MKSPPDMLSDIGRALHGEYWQRALARDLDVDERQLRRWLTGSSPLAPNHGIFCDLLEILEARASLVDTQATALKRWLERY